MGGSVSIGRADELRRGIDWPVDAIKALVRATLSEQGLSPAVRRRLGLIADEAESISAFVARTFEQQGVVEAVDVAALVSSIVEVERITHGASIDLLAGGGVTIVGEEAEMRLAVHELISRAKRTAGPRQLVVTVRRDGTGVAVEAGPRAGGIERLDLYDVRPALARTNGAANSNGSANGSANGNGSVNGVTPEQEGNR